VTAKGNQLRSLRTLEYYLGWLSRRHDYPNPRARHASGSQQPQQPSGLLCQPTLAARHSHSSVRPGLRIDCARELTRDSAMKLSSGQA
jgi:hypothetical protein